MVTANQVGTLDAEAGVKQEVLFQFGNTNPTTGVASTPAPTTTTETPNKDIGNIINIALVALACGLVFKYFFK